MNAFTATKVAEGGVSNLVELEVNRVILDDVEVQSLPMIRLKDAYTRKYDAFKRAGEKGAESIRIKEDLYAFSLLTTQAQLGNNVINIPTILSRDSLARAFSLLDANRVDPSFIVLSAQGVASIRRWGMNDLDETTRANIIKSGYLGDLWGAAVLKSDQMTAGKAFVLGPSDMTFYLPVKQDVDVKPLDLNQQGLIGFNCFEIVGFAAHNTWAVAEVNFDSTR